MKPVLVLQHLSADGPAYLGHWLAAHGVPFDLVNAEAGQSAPADLSEHAALAILGGEMSANDPLPGLRRAEALVREAVREGVPTIGHCLGGQLMARALGAAVVAAPAPEIGWQPLQLLAGAEAAAWLGAAGERWVFQWHYESFDLPPGAVRLAGSAACPNQAFALGPHLAMQFHVELDNEKLQRWSREQSPRWTAARARHGSVQSGPQMREGGAARLAAQQALADRIYACWLGAARGDTGRTPKP
jgi:GMP synthase-like glutamine amidotransferase